MILGTVYDMQFYYRLGRFLDYETRELTAKHPERLSESLDSRVKMIKEKGFDVNLEQINGTSYRAFLDEYSVPLSKSIFHDFFSVFRKFSDSSFNMLDVMVKFKEYRSQSARPIYVTAESHNASYLLRDGLDI